MPVSNDQSGLNGRSGDISSTLRRSSTRDCPAGEHSRAAVGYRRAPGCVTGPAWKVMEAPSSNPPAGPAGTYSHPQNF